MGGIGDLAKTAPRKEPPGARPASAFVAALTLARARPLASALTLARARTLPWARTLAGACTLAGARPASAFAAARTLARAYTRRRHHVHHR
jgi:hypothetical protein